MYHEHRSGGNSLNYANITQILLVSRIIIFLLLKFIAVAWTERDFHAKGCFIF